MPRVPKEILRDKSKKKNKNNAKSTKRNIRSSKVSKKKYY